MKSIHILILWLFFQPVFPQKTTDQFLFRASYTFSYKTDPLQKDFVETDLIYLDIGNNSSKYYSRYTQVRDSNKIAGLKKGLSAYDVVEDNRRFKKGTKTTIYNMDEPGQFHVIEHLVDYYYYDEKRFLPAWTFGAGEKTIAGYACKEAQAIYLGRKWTVYFAPEIPLNKGPWKLWGLPGLIIYAIDSEQLFQFELQGFETLKYETPVSIENKTQYGRLYKKTTKKDYQKMEALRYRDFMTFTNLFILEGKGGILLSPEQERENERYRKKGGTPYIPLEKEE